MSMDNDIDLSKYSEEEQILMRKDGKELTRDDMIGLCKIILSELSKINKLYDDMFARCEANLTVEKLIQN
jgi:hypothetical protein